VAPVRLDVFADRPELLQAKDLDKYIGHHRALVQQAYKLFGSKHYDHYDFLVAVSEHIRKGGLEHHRSVLIRLTPKSARFSGNPPVPISLDALPVFRRWISDAAMNRCTARHTSGQQPVR